MLKHLPILNLFDSGRPISRRIVALLLIACAVIIFVIFSRISTSNQLERIQKRGELVVLTLNGPTTYYVGPSGETGFEYDMLKLFADQLGVKLKIELPDSFSELLPLVAGGSADMAAAGITVTEKRKELVNFGPSYIDNTQQLVFRAGQHQRPKNIGETVNKSFRVIAGSSHEEMLHKLKEMYPNLAWETSLDVDTEELLRDIEQKNLDFTIADSNYVKVARRFMPELRVAFDLGDPEQIAWAFPKDDTSLLDAATAFFKQIENNGQLTQLVERHFGHIKRFDYVDKRIFLRQVEERLPLYELSFKQAAEETGFDWRLLAAVGYQESHWNPNATSPTGVRGLMMLTQATAAQMKVKDRLEPRQAIFGGARYLVRMLNKIPERITEPDRTWMALAAYNVGYGHLEDARIIASKQGKSPDKWVDVKNALPLLTKRKYYKKAKHGYARGWEPVHYVSNIRDYYDILVWYTERDNNSGVPQPDVEIHEPPAL